MMLNEDSEDSEDAYEMEEIMQEPEEHDDEQERRPAIDARMNSLPPPVIRNNIDPRGMWNSSNTGPKGVKADYKEAQRNTVTIRMREKMIRERELEALATGRKEIIYETAAPAPVQKHRPNESSDEDSDEEEFQKFKMERIKLAQAALPVYGVCERLSRAQWTDTIKNTHELVYVVAHLYENDIPACTKLNLCLEAMAPRFPHVRFCRVRSTEAIKGYSRAGLPAIIVYKAGNMVHSFVRVTDSIGPINDLSVAQFFAKQGIFRDQATAAVTSGLTRPTR
jgi:hypothetical protein